MKWLRKGQQDKAEILKLLELTSIKENMQKAIVLHLCDGRSLTVASMLCDVKHNNLSVNLDKLEQKLEIVQAYIDLKRMKCM